MSLAINIDLVESVLLNDGWYEVAEDSFTLDSYEYIWWPPSAKRKQDEPNVVHSAGQGGVCPNGFSFRVAGGKLIAGPLSAIQAVRHRRAAE